MIQTVFIGLAVSSVFTSLITEAFKKIFDEIGFVYYSNVLAAVVSVIVGGCFGFGYMLYNEIIFSVQWILAVLSLIILSFLCATLGYDKVIQTISQLGGNE